MSNQHEQQPTLSGKIKGLLSERGIRPASAADSLANNSGRGRRNRATFYRLLSGGSFDPRISTVIAVAATLGEEPAADIDYLLDQKQPVRSELEGELHQAQLDLDRMSDADKRLAVTLLGIVLDRRAAINQGIQSPLPRRRRTTA